MQSNPSNNTHSLKQIRRTAAHLLAYALHDLFPEVKLIAAKATDLGFYCDFFMPQNLTEDMLVLVEERMRGACKEELLFEAIDMMKENAIGMFRHQNQPFKVKELELLDDNIVQLWKTEDFLDVCAFPLPESLNVAQAFKLLKLQRKTITLPVLENGEKVYEKQQILRITGTVASDKQALKGFLKKLAAVKDFDHQTLGAEMELLTVQKEASLGSVFWLPNGMFIVDALLNFLKNENQMRKIFPVSTPDILNQDFLKKSFDQNASFSLEIEGEDYLLTSQKSTLHALLYQSKKRQVNDLPIRYSEVTKGFFAGESDELNDLFQTRTFLTDSFHIFCRSEEVHQELISCLQLIDKTVKILGFEYIYVLNVYKPKRAKTIASWKESGGFLERALNELGFQFVIDKEGINHYSNQNNIANDCGPTIEVEITDSLGRKWKTASLGLDLVTRESFGLSYLDREGRKQAPQMISGSIFRSLERFIALLIERNLGVLPLWLAPTEVAVLPLAERNLGYAKKVEDCLLQAGVRVFIDEDLGKLGEKVHRAEKKKVPYMLIVGDNEEKGGTVTVRTCMQDKDRAGVELDSFLKQLCEDKELSLPSQMRR